MKPLCNIYYTDTRLMPNDLYPMQYGEQKCESGYGFGPCIRNNFFIHYIYKGTGTFTAEGKTYHIAPGQLFLIYPGQLTYYQADKDDPWFYRWIEFNGNFSEVLCKMAGISKRSPIFTDNRDFSVGNALEKLVDKGNTNFETLMSDLWNFISELTKDFKCNNNTAPSEEYVRKASNYIKLNLHKKITVKDISEYVGIDRSYLSRLFKQYKGISTQQYIIAAKLDTAAQYLKNKQLSVKQVAKSIGYDDQLEFSKAFKIRFKVSPSEWRCEDFSQQSIKEYK